MKTGTFVSLALALCLGSALPACSAAVGDEAAASKDDALSAAKRAKSCALDRDCATFSVPSGKVAECDNGTSKCVAVAPADIQCGGNLRNAHQCASDWRCDFGGHVADLPGKCVQECGGIRGLSCADSGAVCRYDAGCDPAQGGADCMGTCQAPVCIQRIACMKYAHFDHTACTCVSNPTCTYDSDCPASGQCVPDPNNQCDWSLISCKGVCTTN